MSEDSSKALSDMTYDDHFAAYSSAILNSTDWKPNPFGKTAAEKRRDMMAAIWRDNILDKLGLL